MLRGFNFTPYPKNSIIQQFFAKIGRTDIIGSGVSRKFALS